MVSPYVKIILLDVPAKIMLRAYGIRVFHAILGLIDLLLGVFVVLQAIGLMP
jgi:hypothetical protein